MVVHYAGGCLRVQNRGGSLEGIENVGCNKWKEKNNTVLCRGEKAFGVKRDTYAHVCTLVVSDELCYGVTA